MLSIIILCIIYFANNEILYIPLFDQNPLHHMSYSYNGPYNGPYNRPYNKSVNITHLGYSHITV